MTTILSRQILLPVNRKFLWTINTSQKSSNPTEVVYELPDGQVNKQLRQARRLLLFVQNHYHVTELYKSMFFSQHDRFFRTNRKIVRGMLRTSIRINKNILTKNYDLSSTICLYSIVCEQICAFMLMTSWSTHYWPNKCF